MKRFTKAEMDELFIAATNHIESVPYKVTLRWLFYRLLQDGYYSSKGDYKNRLIPAASKWRHGEWWAPDILVDEGRSATGEPGGRRWESDEIIDWFMESLPGYLHRSHFFDQENYIELWFEAQGMLGQFQHFTSDIRLVPFGGDPSIPFKYQIAVNLAWSIRRFKKPATVIYFGDRDDHGEEMFWTAIDGPKGLRKWCSEPFNLVRYGLTEDQAVEYRVPENPDKPGDYQWEALNDDAAGSLIESAVQEYIDPELIAMADEEAQRLADEMEADIRPAIEKALDGDGDRPDDWGDE